jgi:prevent-host-death family protein
MRTASSTDVKNRFGEFVDAAVAEPLLIRKSGRPVAVMLSVAEYERLSALEDNLLGEMARQALSDETVSHDQAVRLLRERLDALSGADHA